MLTHLLTKVTARWAHHHACALLSMRAVWCSQEAWDLAALSINSSDMRAGKIESRYHTEQSTRDTPYADSTQHSTRSSPYNPSAHGPAFTKPIPNKAPRPGEHGRPGSPPERFANARALEPIPGSIDSVTLALHEPFGIEDTGNATPGGRNSAFAQMFSPENIAKSTAEWAATSGQGALGGSCDSGSAQAPPWPLLDANTAAPSTPAASKDGPGSSRGSDPLMTIAPVKTLKSQPDLAQVTIQMDKSPRQREWTSRC